MPDSAVKRFVCKLRGHRYDVGPVYCSRCGSKRRIPYDELAPQDQVDRIAHDENVEFGVALDRWAEGVIGVRGWRRPEAHHERQGDEAAHPDRAEQTAGEVNDEHS